MTGVICGGMSPAGGGSRPPGASVGTAEEFLRMSEHGGGGVDGGRRGRWLCKVTR